MLPLPWRECLTDSIYIGGSAEFLQEEAAHNCCWLSLSDGELASLDAETVYEFIRDVIEDRHRQVREQNCGSAVFYLWCDEMAGQLRFNVISDCHPTLPFRCLIRLVASPATIVERFLVSQSPEGIPFSLLEEVPLSEAFDANGQPTGPDAPPTNVLDVYMVRLNAMRSD